MVYFITVLRALATCIITNSHYNGVYPLDFIANGGLIGNMIFCAVSGYCLYNVRQSFPRWYAKRLIRCYIPVWIITGIYMLAGFFTTVEQGVLSSFIYPTRYHFISSIVLLYIPYYLVMKCRALRERIPMVIAVLSGLILIYYVFFFDKSYYHVEVVRGIIYRTALFLSMLMGARLRQRDEIMRDKFIKWDLLLVPLLFGIYFVLAFVFTKKPELCDFQILSTVSSVVLLYFILRLFAGLDSFFEKLPLAVRRCIEFLATLTLEIYLVQGELIERIRPLFGFPLNWIALTASILAAAFVLHLVSEGVMKLTHLSKNKK